jgi:hypothetical protein
MFLNLTPHQIHMPDGTVLNPFGYAVRCMELTTPAGYIEGMPVIVRTYGEVYNLPPQREGVWLIVSHIVRVSHPERMDLFSPGDLDRDDAGNVIGCRNSVANGVEAVPVAEQV